MKGKNEKEKIWRRMNEGRKENRKEMEEKRK